MFAVQWMLVLFAAYSAIGLFFSIVFVVRGVEAIDPAAHGTGAGFRLMILPGCAALWPLLLIRWLTVLK